MLQYKQKQSVSVPICMFLYIHHSDKWCHGAFYADYWLLFIADNTSLIQYVKAVVIMTSIFMLIQNTMQLYRNKYLEFWKQKLPNRKREVFNQIKTNRINVSQHNQQLVRASVL